MFESFYQTTDAERAILRKLRVWIAALAIVCALAGFGIGALLSEHHAVAQNDLKNAPAPEVLSASFADIAKRVEPAVVNIDTLQASSEIAGSDNEDKDDQANNPLLDMMRKRAVRPTRGVGSGFIVDPKGYILTNQHVIDGATRINASLATGERFRAKVVGIDQETDLAVLKIEAGHELPTLKLGDSNAVQVGDWVLAIGSPFGLDQTVTAGIISKKERDSAFSTFQRFLQTDAAINRGNSGGPLVNLRGEAIGVNSQIATSTGDYNGIGFALPSNEARFVYDQVLAIGKVRRGFLGVTLDSVRSEFAKVYGLSEVRGAIIADVQAERDGKLTPAGKAGLLTNDVIMEFNGQPVQDAQDLIMKVAGTPVGQTVSLAFLRDAEGKVEHHQVSVELAERPDFFASRNSEMPPPTKAKLEPKPGTVYLGLTMAELTPQLIAERHLAGIKGLLVKEVDPNGLAADARPAEVLEGDLITRINRIPVTTLADFQRVSSALKPGDPVVFNLSRYDGQNRRVVQRIAQFTCQ